VELLDYLNRQFLTEGALLDACAASAGELAELQARGVMPRASYRLSVTIDCESYFGPHAERHVLQFYARGYASWLGAVRGASAEQAFALFCARYRAAPGGAAASDELLRSEWAAFLDGTYGLCTRTGLPEEIVAKETAMVAIAALAESPSPDLEKLAAAVDQLDRASSPFAPHERARSSRQRLVDDVRRRYRLP
jgi:hypothetical protein